jgi:hypothetical protein
MGSAPGKALEGGSHPSRLSMMRGGEKVVAHRCSEAVTESGGRRELWRCPAVVGGRGESEGMARRWEKRPRVGSPETGKTARARQQCDRFRLASAPAVGRGGEGGEKAWCSSGR